MDRPNKMERKAYWRLLLWSIGLISLMTSLNVLFIINSLGANVFKPLKRKLASTPVEKKVMKKKFFSPVVEFNCRGKNKKTALSTKAPSARVIFKNCKEIHEILNMSNKSQGSFFPLKRNLATSDYLSLQPGLNKVQIKVDNRSQIIEITREIDQEKKSSKAL